MRLDVGAAVPEFELPDQDGQPFRWRDALGHGPVVVFFYPRDETIVCTKEACGFRDVHADFQALGASIIGISGDSVESHKSFAANHRLPYRILADVDDRVRHDVFGVPRTLLGLRTGRVTYVMDARGVVRDLHKGHLVAQDHIDHALAAVKRLKSSS